MQLTGKVEDRDTQVQGAVTVQNMKAQLEILLARMDALEAEKDRQLEAAKLQHQARHDQEMAERGHAQALESADVGHLHAMEQQEHASESAEASE